MSQQQLETRELIDKLKKVNQNLLVRQSFGELTKDSTNISCSRNYYRDMSINASNNGETLKVSDLIKLIKDSYAKNLYPAYKGGEFNFRPTNSVWLSEGNWDSGYPLIDIKIFEEEGYILLIGGESEL